VPEYIASWIRYLLGDLHEPRLDELRRPCNSIRVNADVRQQVRVTPVMGTRGRAAQLNLYPAPLKVGDEILIGIPARNVPVGIVRPVVQRHVTGIGVKDSEAEGYPSAGGRLGCAFAQFLLEADQAA
jgi:hypothetical protein